MITLILLVLITAVLYVFRRHITTIADTFVVWGTYALIASLALWMYGSISEDTFGAIAILGVIGAAIFGAYKYNTGPL